MEPKSQTGDTTADSTGVRAGDPPIGKPTPSETYKDNLGVRFVVGGATIALYVLACMSPVFDDDRGWECLLWGWFAVFSGTIGWFGNLPFVPALILFFCGKYRIARWFALAALVIGSTSFFLRELPILIIATTHSVGGPNVIKVYGIGLYAWLGSFLVLTVASFGFAWFASSQQVHRDKPNETEQSGHVI